MKKALLVLVALIFIGSLAMADVGVGIWGRTRFYLAQGSDASDDITQGWGPDWSGPGGPQMGIAVWWTSDMLEYHFKIKYNSNEGLINNLNEAYGLLKIMPELTIQIGYREEYDTFRETTPTTFNDLNAENVGRLNGWSILATITPMENLVAAIQYRVPVADALLEDNVTNTAVCASYTMPDMLKITLGTVLNGTEWKSDADILAGGPENFRSVFTRIHALMVPNMTLWLLIKFTGPFEDEADNPANVLVALVGAKYSMDAFSVGAGIEFDYVALKDADLGDPEMAYIVVIEPEYNLGKAAIGMNAKIAGTSVEGSGLGINVIPYVKLPDFSTTIYFDYSMNTEIDDSGTWKLVSSTDFSFW
ncbi:MAG: hypothetical protein JW881_19130 [Spirochaetales bacterium]|nr:hypothetical protein [Spirochaetales bacterium]